jgi:hypothetical protein
LERLTLVLPNYATLCFLDLAETVLLPQQESGFIHVNLAMNDGALGLGFMPLLPNCMPKIPVMWQAYSSLCYTR